MMNCFLRRILPFTLTLLIGAALGNAMKLFSTPWASETTSRSMNTRTYGRGCGKSKRRPLLVNQKTGLISISEPQPRYTKEAWRRGITGVVRLSVTFGADGTIKGVVPIERLPYGLTEEAERAAWQIQFNPATAYGEAISVTEVREYSFSRDDRMAPGL